MTTQCPTAIPNTGLWVREKKRIVLVPFQSITHIHHKKGITGVYAGEKLLKQLRMPLCDLLDKMPEYQFFQPHRNYIINSSFIDRFSREESVIRFVGGLTIPVSRRKRRAFVSFYNSTR